MSRREARRARREARGPEVDPAVMEARREAHRLLRIERGAEAARYVRGAASAVVDPSEFGGLPAWRAFLPPLFPAWGVEMGLALFEPVEHRSRLVVIAPDEAPRRYGSPRPFMGADRGFWSGLLDENGLWKEEPGDPLPEQQPPLVPRRRDADDVRDRFRQAI